MKNLLLSAVLEGYTSAAINVASQNNVTVGMEPSNITDTADKLEAWAKQLRENPESVHGVFGVLIYTDPADIEETTVTSICLGSRSGHVASVGILQSYLLEVERGEADGDASEE